MSSPLASTSPQPPPPPPQSPTTFLNFNLTVAVSNSQPPHFSSLIGKSLNLGSLTNVVVEEVIAEGGFGVIFLVKHEKNKYALKRVVVNNEVDYKNVCREVAIMATLSPKTQHILQSITHMVHTHGGTYELQNLMPLCKQNLLQLASTRMAKNSSFTEQELLQVVHQVSTGLQYLHTSSPPIIHRDIKIENILMLDELYVLSDFGSATTKQWDPTTDQINLIQEDLDKYTTLNYRSPEMVDLYGNRGPLGPASDIWALGVCIYKLMCFKDPFESILAIQNRNLTWVLKTKYSSELVSLVECLLAEYQVVRPTVEETILLSGNGLREDWSLLDDKVKAIKDDLRGRDDLSVRGKEQRGNVVLETTVTPRQRPKRGQGVSNGGASLPPPLAGPPKSPKPVSPGNVGGNNTNARFFSPATTTPAATTISPIPPPHLTPSPSPQPPPTTQSWNPFDEDYQPPAATQHCDNDSIQADDEDDDPFSKAPFDYFKYQPIMVQAQGQQQQPLEFQYAPNNPFVYDVHSSDNNSAAILGVCNLSFDDADRDHVSVD